MKEVRCPACDTVNTLEVEFCTKCGAAMNAIIENDDLDYFPEGEVHDAH